MNVACVLLIKVTLKGLKESEDMEFATSRSLTFPPVEGMTLVFTNEQDQEYELTLGAPRYEFSESAFVEYQEDDSVIDKMRDGLQKEQAVREMVNHYNSFGFRLVNRETRVIKAVSA